MLQLLGTYMMKSVVLGRALFEESDASQKKVGDSKVELNKVKEGYKLN